MDARPDASGRKACDHRGAVDPETIEAEAHDEQVPGMGFARDRREIDQVANIGSIKVVAVQRGETSPLCG